MQQNGEEHWFDAYQSALCVLSCFLYDWFVIDSNFHLEKQCDNTFCKHTIKHSLSIPSRRGSRLGIVSEEHPLDSLDSHIQRDGSDAVGHSAW